MIFLENIKVLQMIKEYIVPYFYDLTLSSDVAIYRMFHDFRA
jgi:hypothetical protein